MNQEVNIKEPANKSELSTAEKSSEEHSNERAESRSLEEAFEKLSKEFFERFREFLCADGSQRATGQGSKGTLKDRAIGRLPEDSPFHLVNLSIELIRPKQCRSGADYS